MCVNSSIGKCFLHRAALSCFLPSSHASRQSDPASYPAAGRYKSIADAPDAVALREKIALALKTTPEQLGTWVVIGDELKCRQSVGMKQVEGITQQMADRANELAEQTFWHIMRQFDTTI